MGLYHGKIAVSQRLWDMRRDRMRRLMALNAPDEVIAVEALLLVRSWKFGWSYHWNAFRLRWFPEWLLKLTSKTYREVLRNEKLERMFT